jgi:hypothetical protein
VLEALKGGRGASGRICCASPNYKPVDLPFCA